MKKTGDNLMKKLYRSRENHKIAGVCGGLSEYFGIDPIIPRIIFLILFLGGGAGFLAYVIMWVLLPLRD